MYLVGFFEFHRFTLGFDWFRSGSMRLTRFFLGFIGFYSVFLDHPLQTIVKRLTQKSCHFLLSERFALHSTQRCEHLLTDDISSPASQMKGRKNNPFCAMYIAAVAVICGHAVIIFRHLAKFRTMQIANLIAVPRAFSLLFLLEFPFLKIPS